MRSELATAEMTPSELVKLGALIERTRGSGDVTIGLIDGPVAADHPDLAGAPIRELAGNGKATCQRADSVACMHGTFVAGILSGRSRASAPSICPDCTLLVRPIFGEAHARPESLPSATPDELAAAIMESVAAGARILNLSVALAQPSPRGLESLEAALDSTVRRGVLVVVAAGNQGTLGSSALTRHPWVIPVIAVDHHGRPLPESNLGSSIGRRGLGAPGEGVTSLGSSGKPLTLGGTSVAAPFVTGAIALLWSLFPGAPAPLVKRCITQASHQRRTSVVPPMLNAEAAFQIMTNSYSKGHRYAAS